MKPLTFRGGCIPCDMPQPARQDLEILISRDALGYQRVPALICGYVGEDGRRKRVLWRPEHPVPPRAESFSGGDAA